MSRFYRKIRNVYLLRNQRRRRWVRRFYPKPSNFGLILVSFALALSVYLLWEKHHMGQVFQSIERTGWKGTTGKGSVDVIIGGNAMKRSAETSIGKQVSGPVSHVRDGDTIELSGIAIRIATLDCAESGTVRGEAATRRMKVLVAKQTLTCDLTGVRSYDRWIGTCFLPDGRNVAGILVHEKACRRFR